MTIAELKRLIDAIYENAPHAEVEATVSRTFVPSGRPKKAAVIGVQYRDCITPDARVIIEVL